MPISAVETDKMSRIAGVRVAQEAINSPGMKKNMKSAQSRCFSALRCEVTGITSHPARKREDNTSKHVYICTHLIAKIMSRRPNDPQRRERILQATLETIAQHGIHAVTHRKIATCADVPLGSMTYYFTGIEALLDEAFTCFTQQMSAQYQPFLLRLIAPQPPVMP
jgi:hypothetical protein